MQTRNPNPIPTPQKLCKRKPGMVVLINNLSVGEARGRGIPGACRPPVYTQLRELWLNEKLSLKKQGRQNSRSITKVDCWPRHAHAHTFTHTQTFSNAKHRATGVGCPWETFVIRELVFGLLTRLPEAFQMLLAVNSSHLMHQLLLHPRSSLFSSHCCSHGSM